MLMAEEAGELMEEAGSRASSGRIGSCYKASIDSTVSRRE